MMARATWTHSTLPMYTAKTFHGEKLERSPLGPPDPLLASAGSNSLWEPVVTVV